MDLSAECGGRHDHEPAADTVTVLVCARGRRAAKRWRTGDDGIAVLDSYDAGFRFATRSEPVDSLGSLARLLVRLDRSPREFVIRGERRSELAGTVGRRLVHDDAKSGERGRYVEVPRRWVAHDLDKLPLPRAYELADLADAREALERARAMLSAEWRRAACVATLTASAGHGDPSRLSARLWFWLDRPAAGAELKAWAQATAAPVDRAIYGAVQPHYTSRPLYVQPLADPFDRRVGVLEGDPVVWLPRYEPARFAADLVRAPYLPRVRDDGDGDRAGRRYARATLEALARELAEAGEGERHATLHAAARRAGGLVPGDWLTVAEIHDELAAAARAAGLGEGRAGEVERTISDAIATGAKSWPWDPPERSRSSAERTRAA